MALEERNVVEFGQASSNKNLSFTNKELQTIRRTMAKGATDDEFRVFMHLAKTYGLDPFNKEIWFIKEGDETPTIMTSRDGYLKIADRNPAYNGLVSDVVRKNDQFERKTDGINHKYGTNRGAIVGAYALVYRKDRKYPVYVFAPFEEYNAHTQVWNQYPSAMILKVAESMSLKRAFTISGLVSREEMEVTQSTPQNIPSSKNTRATTKPDINDNPSLSNREIKVKQLIDQDKTLKRELFDYLRYAKQENNLTRIGIDDLTGKQFKELVNLLQKFSRKN